MLIIPFALLLLARRLLGWRSPTGPNVWQAYLSLSIDVGVVVSFGTIGGPVALSHHPEFFPIAAARNAMLILSNHTHGGRPLMVVYDYMHGIYRW